MSDSDFESKHPRHPAHTSGGKGGQFADKHGVPTDWAARIAARAPYRRGRWERDDQFKEGITFERGVRDTLRSAGLSDKEIEDAVSKMEIPEPDAVLINGPHTIQDFVGLQPQILDAFAEMVDALYSQFKPADGGPLSISIVPKQGMPDYDDTKPDEKMAGGATVAGTGIMWLNVEAFFAPPQGRFWMPVGQMVNPMSYVVAHEWGHVVDDDADAEKPGRQAFFERTSPTMSRYGRSSPAEAYAEAFAEWFLTGGDPIHPMAREYARRFGWPKPNPV